MNAGNGGIMAEAKRQREARKRDMIEGDACLIRVFREVHGGRSPTSADALRAWAGSSDGLEAFRRDAEAQVAVILLLRDTKMISEEQAGTILDRMRSEPDDLALGFHVRVLEQAAKGLPIYPDDDDDVPLLLLT
jgi:hypothetical protein